MNNITAIALSLGADLGRRVPAEFAASLNDTIKAARGCDRCGYRANVRALEWAHRPGAPVARTKTGRRILPADMVKASGDGLTRYALRVWLQDLEGCDLLCATCHREDTFPEETPDRVLLQRALDALDALHERPTTIMGRFLDQGEEVFGARQQIKALLNHLHALDLAQESDAEKRDRLISEYLARGGGETRV